MFTIGNSNTNAPSSGQADSALQGDQYTVKAKRFPWGDKIDE
jgi:hypothetical protein